MKGRGHQTAANRTVTCLLILAIVIETVTGCSASGKTASDNGSETFTPALDTNTDATVEIVGLLENFESLEAVIKDFNQVYPKAVISYSKMDDYKNTLPIKALGDNPPEIFMSYRSYFMDNQQLVDNMLDLSDLKLDTGIFSKKVAEASMYDGKLLRVPLMLNYQGMAVNTSLLEKEGLKVPTTYEEFTSTCDALISKGYTPIQGFPETVYTDLLYNEWGIRLVRDKDGAAIDALNKGSEGCGEYLRSEFTILDDYRQKGYFDDTVNQTISDSYDKSILHFFEGNTPFLVCSTETMSGMKKRETKSEAFTKNPFTYEFCILPVTESGTTALVSVWDSFSILKNSDQTDLAKEFLRFLVSKKELNQMAQIKGLPTAVDGGNGDSRFTSLNSIPEDEKMYSNEINLSTAVTSAYKKYAILVAEGQCSVDEAVSGLPQEIRNGSK
ncbi:MAG: ABC transporter substrate-binding protein [Lachnospiraceae bacterium]|jgi:raffinose/stachyose/melibiose transport system substrate-binding protein|nr:ABC transporter substrate-binding protein [Lachnospiraceae bacterium]